MNNGNLFKIIAVIIKRCIDLVIIARSLFDQRIVMYLYINKQVTATRWELRRDNNHYETSISKNNRPA